MTDERSASNAARLENVDWVEEQICSWTTKHTRAEIMEKLNGTIPRVRFRTWPISMRTHTLKQGGC